MPLNRHGGRPFRSNRQSRPNYNSNRSRGRFKKSDWAQFDIVKRIESAAQSIMANQQPEESYVAKHTFEDFQLSQFLKQNVYIKGYKTPTPIQDQAIPAILEGKDLIGIANTGTGKTAAFLIPLIEKIYKNKQERVLIISPTRELAEQIDKEFRDFVKGQNIFSTLCIGGKSMNMQMSLLKRGSHFIIGTPGRIKDLVKRKALNLGSFTNVVLDETDRMVDIGFIDEIKYFISLLPSKRQSLFFSATVSPKVKEILQAFVSDPVTISVKKQETAANVQQEIVRTPAGKQKIDHLHDLLTKENFSKVLIFGRTKWGVQKLSDELVKRGFSAGAIHGNKSQGQRQQVLDKFKTNRIRILLATDVASRGLDIKDVSHVINYELPDSYDEYVHRIGRTGRANKKGVALTFVN